MPPGKNVGEITKDEPNVNKVNVVNIGLILNVSDIISEQLPKIPVKNMNVAEFSSTSYEKTEKGKIQINNLLDDLCKKYKTTIRKIIVCVNLDDSHASKLALSKGSKFDYEFRKKVTRLFFSNPRPPESMNSLQKNTKISACYFKRQQNEGNYNDIEYALIRCSKLVQNKIRMP